MELLLDDSWGNWKFHPSSIELLENICLSTDEKEEIPFVYCRLITCLRSTINQEVNVIGRSTTPSPTLNDYSSSSEDESLVDHCDLKEASPKKFVQDEKQDSEINKYDQSTLINFTGTDVVQKLIENVKSKSVSSDLASALGCETGLNIVEIVRTVWEKLTDVNEKQHFITCLSCNSSFASGFCKSVLLSLFQRENLYATLELLIPVAKLLGNSLVKDTILVLLQTEDSLFSEDTSGLKDLTNYLSFEQKTQLLSGFLCLVNNELKHWHIPVLTILIDKLSETDAPLLEITIDILHKNFIQFNKDRNIGKLLLAVLLAINDIHLEISIIHKAIQIANDFKGLSSFKLKKEVKCLEMKLHSSM